MVIVLEALTPVLDNIKDKSVFTRMEDAFLGISQQVREVGLEGRGSQRIIPIEVHKGTLTVADNTLRWEMDTEADILEPRTQNELGNVLITSNAEVTAAEHNDSFTLENSKLIVIFSKLGSANNYTNFTSDLIINNIYYKTQDKTTEIASPSNRVFKFYINGEDAATSYIGYSEIGKTGKYLGYSTVTVHIKNSTADREYDLVFTLDSEADYLLVEAQPII
jgi:hypothetical protein